MCLPLNVSLSLTLYIYLPQDKTCTKEMQSVHVVMFVTFNRIRWILGFDPAEMVGLKAYEYFHPSDLLATSSCHTTCK